MAMVLRPNCVPGSNSSTTVMDSYTPLEQSTEHEDSLQRTIFDKVEEGKRDRDPEKCQEILNDFSTILKRHTAMVNDYNLAFAETRPPFYLQEFQRLTDQIETITKARDILTEYLHELENQNSTLRLTDASSLNDVSAMHNQLEQQLQYSPTVSHLVCSSPPDRPHSQHTSPITSIQPPNNDPSTPNNHYSSQQFRSPNLTSSTFIRIHFPNKHTTAFAPRSDETLEAALKRRASMHSVTDLHAYTPVYMISRQQCPWDITLNRLLEREIELEEKTKIDHSFVDIRTGRLRSLFGVHCVVCDHRIRDAYKRCVSCGNSYHNLCYTKAPVCSHPILEYMKHLGPDRFTKDRTNVPTQSRDQSRSLPGIPIPRPNININPDVGPQKDISQDPLVIATDVGYFSNTARASSAATPMHHIPQFLLTAYGSPVISPKTLRPSLTKPNTDEISKVKEQKPISDWEIRPDDLLKKGRMIGRGAYGTVYKAEVRLHGTVALKELNFTSPTISQLKSFRNEVTALKKITHQNTLNLYGYILSPRFAIVTQWCEGSTLYKHIHMLDRQWKINRLIDIARQICQGMSYLHDRGIIHRDLKSGNVFLDMSAEVDDEVVCDLVKIGDFGLAAVKTMMTDGANQPSQPTGSIRWMAPEVIQHKDPDCYSTLSDVYAYGCVLFEMFSGKLPHASINTNERIMWGVGKGKVKLDVQQCRDDTPESIVELIRLCTEYDRNLRPNFAPEIEYALSKFAVSFPRWQRSQSEPCLSLNFHEDLPGQSIAFGMSKTPQTIHRRFNAEVS